MPALDYSSNNVRKNILIMPAPREKMYLVLSLQGELL